MKALVKLTALVWFWAMLQMVGCMTLNANNYGDGDLTVYQEKPVNVNTDADVPLPLM